MDIRWKKIDNIEEYVKKTLAEEAEDISQDKINKASWILAEVSFIEIHPNLQMIKDHDKNPIHDKRKNYFINIITKGEEIAPLITLGKGLDLVDGYARFRALRDLGVSKIQVFKQSFA